MKLRYRFGISCPCALLALALLLLCVAISTASAASPQMDSDTDHLNMLSKADLRKILFDKTNGKSYDTADWTKEQLITALRHIEQIEEEQEMLRNKENFNNDEPSMVQLDDDGREAANTTSASNTTPSTPKATGKGNRRTRLMSQQQQQQRRRASVNSNGSQASTNLQSQKSGRVHEVLVLYCTGCGYAKYFVNMKTFLQENLPDADAVDIQGKNYATPTAKAFLAQFCSFSFIALMALSLLSNRLQFLPEQVRTAIENRRGAIFAAAFGLNILGSTISQTGAYEVYVDNKLIYSKLATGSVPDNNFIKDMITQAVQVNK